MEEITKIVADHYGIYYKILTIPGKSTQKESIAKQMCFVLISEFLPHITTPIIGHYFMRDHSTVVFGRKSMLGEIEMDKHRYADYIILKDKISKVEYEKYCRPIKFKITKN